METNLIIAIGVIVILFIWVIVSSRKNRRLTKKNSVLEKENAKLAKECSRSSQHLYLYSIIAHYHYSMAAKLLELPLDIIKSYEGELFGKNGFFEQILKHDASQKNLMYIARCTQAIDSCADSKKKKYLSDKLNIVFSKLTPEDASTIIVSAIKAKELAFPQTSLFEAGYSVFFFFQKGICIIFDEAGEKSAFLEYFNETAHELLNNQITHEQWRDIEIEIRRVNSIFRDLYD